MWITDAGPDGKRLATGKPQDGALRPRESRFFYTAKSNDAQTLAEIPTVPQVLTHGESVPDQPRKTCQAHFNWCSG